MPKVSIIVPIYGVEKYIERCARSLFNQTMEDLEFIFVNDCTKDASMSLLENVISEYPERKVRIVNHDKNLGLPNARLSGLAIASGDYILHCDSDDWLEPNCCEILYNAAKQEDADVVTFKYWIDDGISRVEGRDCDDSLLARKDVALASAILLQSSPYVWNKLVKRELYRNPIVFPEYNLAEDWVLSVQYAYYSKKTVCIDDILYHYFKNTDSIMRKVSKDAFIKRRNDEVANVTLICNWLKNLGLSKKFKWEIVKRKSVAKNQLLPIISDHEANWLWRKTFEEINIPALFCPYLSNQYKRRHLILVSGLYLPFERFFRGRI